jgi:hypothetical protein
MCYGNKHITNTSGTKFLGSNIDETLSWKYHTDHLVTKLSSACYAVRTVKDLMSQETLSMIYFCYEHSVITHGMIFWGSSPYSINIFRIEKHIIRIIMNAETRDSCRELFRNLKILSFYSQYIFSLSQFFVNSKYWYKSNQEIHSFNTRYSVNLHLPTSYLAVFQRGAYYFGIRVFNHLPPSIKSLSDEEILFKPALKKFVLSNSFYSLDEYLNCNFN